MDDNTEYIDDDDTIIKKCPVCKNNISFRDEVEICYCKKSMHEHCARYCEDCYEFICPKHTVYKYSDIEPNLCLKCARKHIIETIKYIWKDL